MNWKEELITLIVFAVGLWDRPLSEAILISYNERDEPLDIAYTGSGAVWDPEKDQSWQHYKKARDIIYYKAPILDKILSKLELI